MRSFRLALSVGLLLVGQSVAQDKCSAPVVIPGVLGTAMTSKFGDGYVTRTSDGKSYTTSRFGSGWITRGSDGQTFTTSKFGDGAISRSSSGASATTSRFGSGFTTSQSSERALELATQQTSVRKSISRRLSGD